jgi:hypothetical protein
MHIDGCDTSVFLIDKDLSLLAVWLHKKMHKNPPPAICLPGSHHPEREASREICHCGTRGVTRADA